MAHKAPAKVEETRRTERVLLKIPIQVRGKQADGTPFKENSFTLVINRHGARIGLKSSLRAGDQVTIKNLQNELSCPFRVVARTGKSLGEGPEWGVECLEPDVNFWGIHFPDKHTAPAAQEGIDALLECSSCHFRELAPLTPDEYRSLVNQSSLVRKCGQCARETAWGFGFADAEAEEAGVPPLAPTAASPAPDVSRERRRAKRLTVKVPVRVRSAQGLEEVTRSENLSTSGACFISRLIMKQGDRLRITVGYAPGGSESELPARVVWRRDFDGVDRACYGVHIEESR